MSNTLMDLWPKGVGYDTWTGYNEEKYDSQKDQIQRLELLVASWKATALDHGFSSDNIRTLSCQRFEKGQQLTFLNSSLEPVVLKGEVKTAEVSIDVDQDPEDTCVTIRICGRNYDTAKDFTFFLSVYRRPAVRSNTLLTTD